MPFRKIPSDFLYSAEKNEGILPIDPVGIGNKKTAHEGR